MHNNSFYLFNMATGPSEAEKERMRIATNYMNRRKYGKHKGHFKWDLAVSYFRMDNDTFFSVWGFNFVPEGRLWEEAKDYRWKYLN
ncbi:hypothetical protein [Jeotgalibacillus proteolyticus]|uniref:Uncharacterized protein n=1 Tax=Jeotgalibacillus proteolyticus TaxID=2082395 RepID=A0A2S5GAQ9_9BACL|nr:hypothetical protein [Jeotgalibacillus proteolyticus]PPA70058.1 hypothetical protein C4B60_10715 [Jeotgalibacillus proteolyticus]